MAPIQRIVAAQRIDLVVSTILLGMTAIRDAHGLSPRSGGGQRNYSKQFRQLLLACKLHMIGTITFISIVSR